MSLIPTDIYQHIRKVINKCTTKPASKGTHLKTTCTQLWSFCVSGFHGSLWWPPVNSRKLAVFCSSYSYIFPPPLCLFLNNSFSQSPYRPVLFFFSNPFLFWDLLLYSKAFSLEFLTQTHSFHPLQMYTSAYFCVLCLFGVCRSLTDASSLF